MFSEVWWNSDLPAIFAIRCRYHVTITSSGQSKSNATSPQPQFWEMADDKEVEKTIAEDLVVTKYKLAGQIVNRKFMWDYLCLF